MRVAATIWANDLRNIIRDRTVGALLFVPLILLALLRFGIPPLERQLPDLAGLAPLAVGFLSVMASMFPAFMMSFIMLDERDQGLFPAFRVLPVPIGRVLRLRLAMITALSAFYPLLLVLGSGLVELPLAAVALLAAASALSSPAATLIAVSVAGNKIEGLTVFKGLFFLVALAALGAALDQTWTAVLAVLPTYWIYVAFLADDAAALAADASVAVALHALVIAVAYRRFRGRVR